MAVAAVTRQLSAMGATPVLRLKEGKPYLTDNACCIIDAVGLEIRDPVALEQAINAWPGVVSVGLFAVKGANVCLLGTVDGVKTMKF
jgi:ribose 5-phosphate isomerase A